MKLRELFNLITKIGSENGIPKIYLCGGAVRDRIVGSLDKLEDIDLTTGDWRIKNLGVEIRRELSKNFSIDAKEMNDGHLSIFLDTIKLDFSSNFIDPSVEAYLKSKGIDKPTDLQKEMFSRDFTVNSLIMDLDLKTAYDPTKMGMRDIKARVLRTCLPPEITLKSNVNRVIRVLYLASKLNFSVDPKIIKYISDNKDLFAQIDPGYLSKTFNKAITYNATKTVELMDQIGLWNTLPIPESLYPEYAKRFKKASGEELAIKLAQLRRNFDYGEGFYANIQNVKSVSDFQRKRKKKQKKEVKKIKDMKLK